MQNKFNQTLDFSGHNIYVGLDVHGKSWAVDIIVDDLPFKKFTQPPNPDLLSDYLKKNFPGASYHSAYECGFSGYGHHRRLLQLGIQNIVINPADLPITDKEKVNKRDPLDSKRISRALMHNQLKGIYVFQPVHEQLRTLSRMRWKAAKEHRRVKNRIRSFLYYYGITPPQDLNSEYWSLAFIHWLKYLEFPIQSGKMSLNFLLNSYQTTKDQLLEVTRQLRKQIKALYPKEYTRIKTVVGVGPITTMTLIAEIGDIARFKTFKHLSSFVGLVPRSHQSGDKDPNCSLTYRSNKYLRSVLVEAAWVAIRNDPALLQYYKERIVKSKPPYVIIKVAHKLLNRIRNVWINEVNYQTCIVN